MLDVWPACLMWACMWLDQLADSSGRKPLTHDPSQRPVLTAVVTDVLWQPSWRPSWRHPCHTTRLDGRRDGRCFLAAVLTAVVTAVKTAAKNIARRAWRPSRRAVVTGRVSGAVTLSHGTHSRYAICHPVNLPRYAFQLLLSISRRLPVKSGQ